jgi:uncharacterized membrane protein YGL010W
MMGGRTSEEWVAQYATSHQHPINRTCHTFGIPMIALSILLVPVAWAGMLRWWIPAGLFVFGWILQFVGHAFEGKPPEFFRDWRFLFVGLRWWIAHTRINKHLAGKQSRS